jgi:hypothetical protein
MKTGLLKECQLHHVSQEVTQEMECGEPIMKNPIENPQPGGKPGIGQKWHLPETIEPITSDDIPDGEKDVDEIEEQQVIDAIRDPHSETSPPVKPFNMPM